MNPFDEADEDLQDDGPAGLDALLRVLDLLLDDPNRRPE